MQERIDQSFEQARAENRANFIAYICAGDPSLEATREIALALEEAGVDILELGLPFSDPLADGVVNQAASQRALEAGATTEKVFAMIKDLRQKLTIPIVLYSYLNPIYIYGYQAFHQAAAEAGIDGLLVLDMPPDEEKRNAELAESSGLAHIRLVAPTTPEKRIAAIVAAGTGFIYYVSQMGVTGERAEVAASVEDAVTMIKRHTELPVAVGFGISKPQHVQQVAACADGVVVGSAIVRKIEEFGSDLDVASKVAGFVRPLARAKK